MKKVLIDTNIYSFAMRGDAGVVKALRRIDVIGFSAISIGELLSGFKGGKLESRNIEDLHAFLDSPRVVVHSVDAGTADFYATVLSNLRRAGTPVPTNDIWIAAIVFQHGYQLFSQDNHFNHVPGLVRYQ